MRPKPIPKKINLEEWLEKCDARTKPKKRDWLEDIYKGYIDFQKDYEKYNISLKAGYELGEDLATIIMRNTAGQEECLDEDDGRWIPGQLVQLDPLLNEPTRTVAWGDIQEGWVGIIIELCQSRRAGNPTLPPFVRVLWPNGDLEEMSADDLTPCTILEEE